MKEPYFAYSEYSNYFDVEHGQAYWVSGIKRNGKDRHWAGSWPEFSTSTYKENFNMLFQLCCVESNINEQHQVMLNSWIDDLAKGLWEFNDQYGNWEDYRYKALQGVYSLNDPCSNEVLSRENYDLYKSQYENNIIEQNSFDSCN